MKEIFTRRSIRKFNEHQITRNELEILVKAGMYAPSAGNQQPWWFYIIDDKETLVKLAEFGQYSKPLLTASAAIIVAIKDDELRFPEALSMDLSAATQNILLEAKSLDIGSVWMLTYPEEDRIKKVKEIVDLNDDIPFAVIALGYHDQEGTMPPKDLNRFSYVSAK